MNYKKLIDEIPDICNCKDKFFTPPRTRKVFFQKRYFCLEEENDSALFEKLLATSFETLVMYICMFFHPKKYRYFLKNEKGRNEIYKKMDKYDIDNFLNDEKDGILNIGHATSLIKVNGLKILVDPVLFHMSPILYRNKTETNKIFKSHIFWDEIRLDLILITHNHDDHTNLKTLREIFVKMKNQPKIVVPEGSKKVFEDLGFNDIDELRWYEQFELMSNGANVTITSVAAEHWSGQGLIDIQNSATSGYIINNESNNNIFYLSGDTVALSEKRMKDLAFAMLIVQKQKCKGLKNKLPNLVNISPDGPNYSRDRMKAVHQSFVESIMASFRLVIEMKKIGALYKKTVFKKFDLNVEKFDHEEMFESIKLFLNHDNKFRLGPDRFHEGRNIIEDKILPIFRKCREHMVEGENLKNLILDRLNDLYEHEMRKKKKNWIHLLRYYDDWLYKQMMDLIRLNDQIMIHNSDKERMDFLEKYLSKIVGKSFLKINEIIEF